MARQTVTRIPILLTMILVGWATFTSPGRAAEPAHRVLPVGQLPSDSRLGPLKDLNGYFPFLVPSSKAVWRERADELRTQVLVALGLWPMPSKTNLEPVVHSRRDEHEYTVEKVFFQSMPGFFVTGNLYRPKSPTGRRPGVLCPHGHWNEGRFYDCGRDSVRLQIVDGAERFENGGRSPMQSRCVQLARMGCVVFHWDMIGYADSQQIPSSIIHRFARQRPEMNAPDHWGLFSPQAESHLQSAMGLQAYNSIRALDFLSGLEDVDPSRIAVTGASGGGTQTFILSAIDDRPAVSMPAVMVSTAMQGGCTCENASLLRIGTSNVEFAALFAPKPLGLTAADDWTVEMETKGFPELQKIYRQLGAPDHVMIKPLTHFKHNYNYVSRAALYHWINKHFKLKLPEPIVEEDYNRLTAEELTVWDQQHAQPQGGPEFERKLLDWWHQDSRRQLRAMMPTNAKSLEQYRAMVGAAIGAIILRRLPPAERLEWNVTAREEYDTHVETRGLITHHLDRRQSLALGRAAESAESQEQVPAVLLRPSEWDGRSCLIVARTGKQALFDASGIVRPAIRELLDHHIQVCGIDVLMQGEFVKDGRPVEHTRRVDNPREAAAYTFGYNSSLCARRIHDVLTAVAFLKRGPIASKQVDVVGFRGAGQWAAAARAVAPDSIDRLAVDLNGFRFAQVAALDDPNFLPGGAKYDDLPGMLAVGAPRPLWLADGPGVEMPAPIEAAYSAAGKRRSVVRFQGSAEAVQRAAVAWIIRKP